MKTTVIRQGVFETNSSSTHSICIPKNNSKYNIPDSIYFKHGEFGWDVRELRSINDKASYLFQALVDNKKIKYFEDMIKYLQNKYPNMEIFHNNINYNDYGYIDHHDCLLEFIDFLFSDMKMIDDFLFSDLSFIITGNDNIDMNDYPVYTNAINNAKSYDNYFYKKGN